MISIFYSVIGESFQAIKYAENGFETAKRTQDISVIAPLAYDLCFAYMGQGLFYKFMNIVPDVLHVLEEKKMYFDFLFRAIAVYPSLCSLYGFALGALGKFDEGEVFCQKGLHTAARIGELRTLALIEFNTGWFYYAKGDGKLVVEHFKNSIKCCEEAKWYLVIGYAFGGLGYGHYLLGDLENARENVEKGIKIFQDVGLRMRLSFLYWILSMPLFDLGEYGKALDYIDEALILAQKNNEKDSEGLSRIWLGRILGKTDPDQFDKAEESILKGINILEEMRLKPFASQGYLNLGEFYIDIGKKEKAQENLKKAERMFKEMGMDYWLAKTQEVLNRL